MANIIKAPRGTQDILGNESYQWQFLEKTALETAALFGFKEIRTPTFEEMALFKRSVGDTTDVVQKEMYQVQAEKGQDLYGLKPEGTAGAVRAAIQNGLLKEALPLKVCYVTPCFRHERPQAGRLREFHQFGMELFGAQSPSADVEVISAVHHLFQVLGLKNIQLHINSIGCPTCRAEYHKALKAYFEQYRSELCETCLERLEKNPMRILDCKSPVCSKIAKDAPVVLDYLCDECKEHFEGVKARLYALEIPFEIDPTIVRGLDYYTKTVFEFVSNDLGAQSTVCGGGRYDGLVKQMGGDQTPALGFAVGLERLLLILKAQGIEIPKPNTCDLYIASMGDAANIKAGQLAASLRAEGFYVECDLMNRSVKAQMKYANKLGAKMSMVLGDSELETGKAVLKDMETGEQREVEFDSQLSAALYDYNLSKMTDALAEELGENGLADMMGLKG
ncbi:MAG: histidine--tRNA ligase [Massiliimalia sp.]|jgi:histidyl-tRNA synthetase